MKEYYVYIMTGWSNRVLYIGVTSDLERRVLEHKAKAAKGFTAKYNLNKLVFVESTHDVYEAISREKQLKKWSRVKKNKLIFSANPTWGDLMEVS